MILTWEEMGHVTYACGTGGAYVQMPLKRVCTSPRVPRTGH